MHELSIVMSIVELASAQASRHDASVIEEIELDIGCLSGIEMESFDFAWKQAVKRTILENARRTVNRIEGRALCLDCNTDFTMEHLYDGCPNCGSHLSQIRSGKELKLRSLVLPD
ncbi:MAG: hydrogenase maturation nickel metallochaperone HypA [Chitinophagaceae bacterium]|nr:hydrogenase maturation nickel metallochaperone HypA [Chitinophagaceae bacterium]MEA3425883.1 hydrogenase maturation nickel metallochaperone HypA [Bacteroidota bacterium]MCA6453448.1 hydrogenase maturation nickel metallochaperone HypA [Chitinophagaceae bacterium]MCA6455231.1 hydrogenase maturation nickel metallochaperone HypA [Chitinophagaceae bacterium]MCA6460031.1 hydrogenase maturation nickel metallochaperone HypA [Chitinophagaceae bacterium]